MSAASWRGHRVDRAHHGRLPVGPESSEARPVSAGRQWLRRRYGPAPARVVVWVVRSRPVAESISLLTAWLGRARSARRSRSPPSATPLPKAQQRPGRK
jgi:hypothetical protein